MSASQELRGRLDVTYPPASPALLSVIICMTILAVCAIMYFAFRCYYEERHLRNATCRKCATDDATVHLAPRQEVVPPPPEEEITTPPAYHHNSPVTRHRLDYPSRIRTEGSDYRRTRRMRKLNPALSYSDVPIRSAPDIPTRNIPEIVVSSPRMGSSFTIHRSLRRVPVDCHFTTTISSASSVSEQVIQPNTSPFHPRYNTPVSDDNEGQSMTDENSPQGSATTVAPLEARDPAPEGVSETSLDNQTPKSARRSYLLTCTERYTANQEHTTVQAGAYAGGKLVTRWTQTEGGSLTSLDWDPYDSERLRCLDTDAHNDFSFSPVMRNLNLNETVVASSPYVIYYQDEEQIEPLDLTYRQSKIRY